MRTFLVTLFLLVASSAFAQYNGQTLPSQTNPWRPAYHEEHVRRDGVRREQNINPSQGVAFARGEMPSADLKLELETPLGDLARAYREDHKNAKKAVIKLEN
jgi:hypothetical protein